MELLFTHSTHTVQVLKDPENQVMVMRFCGRITHRAYVESSEYFLMALKKFNYHNLLYDNSKLITVSLQSRAWFMRKFIKKLYDPNYRIAIIKSASLSSRIAVDTMKEYMEQMGYVFTMEVVDTKAEAIDFLLRK